MTIGTIKAAIGKRISMEIGTNIMLWLMMIMSMLSGGRLGSVTMQWLMMQNLIAMMTLHNFLHHGEQWLMMTTSMHYGLVEAHQCIWQAMMRSVQRMMMRHGKNMAEQKANTIATNTATIL